MSKLDVTGKAIRWWSNVGDYPSLKRGRCWCGDSLAFDLDWHYTGTYVTLNGLSRMENRVTVSHGEISVFCTNSRMTELTMSEGTEAWLEVLRSILDQHHEAISMLRTKEY